MSIGVVRWEDPPESGRGRGSLTFSAEAIAAQLRLSPRRWAVVAEAPPNYHSLTNHIATGHRKAFQPAGAYEAVFRLVGGVPTVYARYVGEPSPEVQR